MSQAQRLRQSLGEASTPGSTRKRGRPAGKSTPASMGPKKGGKRASTGGNRASTGGKRASTGGRRVITGSAIERELGHISALRRYGCRGEMLIASK